MASDDLLVCSTAGTFIGDNADYDVSDEWGQFDMPPISTLIDTSDYMSRVELTKLWIDNVYGPLDLSKIPVVDLRMTLAGCKIKLTTSINVENVRESFKLTETIPIIESGQFMIMSLNLDYSKFRIKSKKSHLYRFIYKLVKPYLERKEEATLLCQYQMDNKKRCREGIITVYPNAEIPYLVFKPLPDAKFRIEMKSQIQFNIFSDAGKVYCVKRFINGSVQVPNCKDIVGFTDLYDVVDKLIDYENKYYTKYVYKCDECIAGKEPSETCKCLLREPVTYEPGELPTIILQNFRFQILDTWKVNLDLLYQELLAKYNRDTLYKGCDEVELLDEVEIHNIKYNSGDVRLTVRFKALNLVRKNKYVTVSITNQGKCNIQGSVPAAPTNEIYRYLVGIFKCHPEWYYIPAPSDEELDLFQSTQSLMINVSSAT